jgi:hypothetical protein
LLVLYTTQHITKQIGGSPIIGYSQRVNNTTTNNNNNNYKTHWCCKEHDPKSDISQFSSTMRLMERTPKIRVDATKNVDQ